MRLHVAVLAAAIAFTASWSTASAQEQRSQEEIEKIVRDYLLREPEIVYEAIQLLQARQQEEEAARRRDMLSQLAPEIFNNPDDPVAGNLDGDVTLVEFFDYQCGYCRRMAPSLQALMRDDTDLRVVFKELPVLGPDSVTAARAALAASKVAPDRYQSFHFALMDASDLSEATILAEAESVGIDPAALKEAMQSEEVAQAIQRNLQVAGSLGINGTPSFIVGETIIPGAVPIEHLTQLIDDVRNGESEG